MVNIWSDLGLVFVIVAGSWSVFTLWPVVIGAGFQPTSKKAVGRMLALANVGAADTVYDLGSGDGRLLVESAKLFGAKSVGIEADPLRVAWSRILISRAGVGERARVIWANFFRVNISEASVVTLFLMAGTNSRLRTKFTSELKPGTRIVSHEWRIEGWRPVAEDKEQKVYLYVV